LTIDDIIQIAHNIVIIIVVVVLFHHSLLVACLARVFGTTIAMSKHLAPPASKWTFPWQSVRNVLVAEVTSVLDTS
jgi:hypothetical protein